MTRKGALILFAAVAAGACVLDALGKMWALAALTPQGGGAARIDAGPLDFTLVHNTGAAFGIGANATWVFVVVTVVIVAAALVWICAGKCRSPLSVVALALLVGGGVGNFIDRVALGYVVDFIEFSFFDFPVFNVADVCITTGVVLLLVWGFFFSGRELAGGGAAAGGPAGESAGKGGKGAASGAAPAGGQGVAAGGAGGQAVAAGEGKADAAPSGAAGDEPLSASASAAFSGRERA